MQTPTIRIEIHEGDQTVREEVFTRKIIRIGKAGQAHLRLKDVNAASQHASIEVLETGEIRLSDMETTGGTMLNGTKVPSAGASLAPGDTITIADTKLVVFFEATAVRSAGDAFFDRSAAQEVKTDRTGLEVELSWGTHVLHKHFHPAGAPVTIGNTSDCSIALPAELIGSDKIEFAKPDGSEFLVDVAGDKFESDFLVGGKMVRLPEMERRGKVLEGRYVRIDTDTRARLRFGAFTLVAGLAYLPQKPKTSWWKKFNMRDHVFFMLSLILHLLFMILVTLVPEDQLKANRDPYERNTQALKKIQVAMLERKIEEEKKAAEEEAQKKLKEAADNQLKTELAIKVENQPTSKIVTDEATNKKAADTALTRVMGQQQDLLNRVLDAAGPGLGGGTMGIRVIGSRGMDAELAMGLDAFGGALGGGGGMGGFRGTGGWGGAGEFGPADLKGVMGKETDAGRNVRIGSLGGGSPVVYSGPVGITGELDKETVRRYIQTKMDQIRWCYQQEVQRNPELAGQIKIEWVILPTGKVAAAKVAGSSMNNASVEQCIVSRVATWQFPSPKGGGTVKVNYPFIFRVTK